MKSFAIIPASLVIFSTLAGCTTSSSPSQSLDRTDPRYVTLLDMPVAQFYGTLAIAQAVDSSCAELARNPRIDLELNERRNEKGNGSFSALSQRQAISNAQTAVVRDFRAQHGENLCTVALRDVGQASAPYTFFLQPVSGT